MPDYKRLVSYMYNYEDGMKKNNVGYARVEARNGQCKCTLHIAAPSLNDKQLKVYIFKRRKDGLEGIILGTFQVKNGIGDYKTVTDSVHIMNSSYGLDDMGGIVLYLTERKFFATSWDDAPITMDLVAGIENRKYEKELQAAAVYVTRLDKPSDNQKKNTETPKEAVIIKNVFPEPDESEPQQKKQDKKELQESVETVKEQVNKALEDSVYQIEQQEIKEESLNSEGEVFNDLVGGNETDQSGLNTEIKQKELAAEEVSKEDNQKDNKEDLIEEKDEKKEKDSIIEELNAPVEILQKEELQEANKEQLEENNSSEGNNNDNPDTDTYDPFRQDSFTDNLNYNSFNESVEADQFNAGETTAFDNTFDNFNSQNGNLQNVMEPQTLAEEIQTDIKGEECQKDGERQPFFEDHPLAKRIYRSFPRMYPFEDNEIAWCVRIEPQNIGLFPMEAWILGNNSFLLHGYYSYRHLIFARMNDKSGFSYILGVPGIYHNREKFMAKMFGFENFKCVKRKVQRTGEFGYWYIPITLN